MSLHTPRYSALPFAGRKEAGRLLGEYLKGYLRQFGPSPSDLVVLGLPRGGVVVASEVAKVIGADLDVLPSRKLGAPSNPELAIGAVSVAGDPYLSPSAFRFASEEWIRRETEAQRARVAQQIRLFRKSDEYLYLTDKVCVVVDDGTATGATALAACNALVQLGAAEVWVAVPVAPPEALGLLDEVADEVFCLAVRADFQAVGMWYVDFGQTSDDEVRAILEEFRRGDEAQ